mmetsp:Transcript_24337/g.55559  ORF Transcript_24337/g.55559 Transcript_24337/m.55559 type:complete len:394 (-) Transcript_24337:14-1195(-)
MGPEEAETVLCTSCQVENRVPTGTSRYRCFHCRAEVFLPRQQSSAATGASGRGTSDALDASSPSAQPRRNVNSVNRKAPAATKMFAQFKQQVFGGGGAVPQQKAAAEEWTEEDRQLALALQMSVDERSSAVPVDKSLASVFEDLPALLQKFAREARQLREALSDSRAQCAAQQEELATCHISVQTLEAQVAHLSSNSGTAEMQFLRDTVCEYERLFSPSESAVRSSSIEAADDREVADETSHLFDAQQCRERVQDSARQMSHLRRSLERKQAELDDSENVINQLMVQIADLQQEKNDMREQIDVRDEELQRLRAEVADLRGDVRSQGCREFAPPARHSIGPAEDRDGSGSVAAGAPLESEDSTAGSVAPPSSDRQFQAIGGNVTPENQAELPG